MSRDREFVRGYYDDFSVNYDQPRARGYHKLIDDLEFSLLERYVRGRNALEVGCGTGLLLERVAAIAKSAKGIDLSPGMLAHAGARGLCVEEGSATALPHAPNSFDVAYSFKVLAHVADIRLALAEMVRVVVPQGFVIAEFYNKHSLRYVARKLSENTGGRRIGAERNEKEVPTRWDTPAECESYVPQGAHVVARHGVRVFTPWAGAHETPLGPVLRRAEGRALTSPFARFGGFYVLVLQKD